MTAPPNPVAAVVTILLADGDVGPLVGNTHVYASEVPTAEVANMPEPLIVVSLGHGKGSEEFSWQLDENATEPGARSYLRTPSTHVTVRCYGETTDESADIYWVAYGALKRLTRTVADGALVEGASLLDGPREGSTPSTEWPYCEATYTVVTGDVPVS